MRNIFLNAKHWQLFLITFGIPIILQIIFMRSMFSGFRPGAMPSGMANYFSLFALVMIIVVAASFGWFWSVAMGLQKNIPENVKMNVTRFKVAFFIPLIYLVLLLFSLGVLTKEMFPRDIVSFVQLIKGYIALMFALHFFSMLCILYCLYFVAKTIKTVELQRKLTFSDFAGEFFMIWFYPVGIWIIQPRINRLVEEEIGI